MDSTAAKVFTVIFLLVVPTVMFGGYSLLRLRTQERLSEFQAAYFRAGHAHAGVLLVLSLTAMNTAAGYGVATGSIVLVGLLLLVGTLAQSGGMFIHMGFGAPGRWSPGNTLSVVGAVMLAAALVWLAIAVMAA